MAAQMVKLRHPTLGEFDSHPLSVPSWLARGWELVEDKPASPAPKTPDGEQEQDKPPARPRRRHSEEK